MTELLDKNICEKKKKKEREQTLLIFSTVMFCVENLRTQDQENRT